MTKLNLFIFILFGISLCDGRNNPIRSKRHITEMKEVNFYDDESSEECYEENDSRNHLSTFESYLKSNKTLYPFGHQFQRSYKRIRTKHLQNGELMRRAHFHCDNRLKIITSSTPLKSRALCPFEYVVNYNSKRLPATIIESKCVCKKPNSSLLREKNVLCEPVKFKMLVLVFDEECNTYRESYEHFTLGCVAAQQKNNENDDISDDFIIEVDVDAPTRK